QASSLHLRRRIGDPVLDRLLLRQRAAEGLSLQGALTEHVEGPPGLPQPAHAVVDAAGSEPDLRDLEALANLADDVLLGDLHILVEDLRVAVSEALVLPGHGRDVAQPLDPWGIGRHQE